VYSSRHRCPPLFVLGRRARKLREQVEQESANACINVARTVVYDSPAGQYRGRAPQFRVFTRAATYRERLGHSCAGRLVLRPHGERELVLGRSYEFSADD
jgi:hypothetical protein